MLPAPLHVASPAEMFSGNMYNFAAATILIAGDLPLLFSLRAELDNEQQTSPKHDDMQYHENTVHTEMSHIPAESRNRCNQEPDNICDSRLSPAADAPQAH